MEAELGEAGEREREKSKSPAYHLREKKEREKKIERRSDSRRKLGSDLAAQNASKMRSRAGNRPLACFQLVIVAEAVVVVISTRAYYTRPTAARFPRSAENLGAGSSSNFYARTRSRRTSIMHSGGRCADEFPD